MLNFMNFSMWICSTFHPMLSFSISIFKYIIMSRCQILELGSHVLTWSPLERLNSEILATNVPFHQQNSHCTHYQCWNHLGTCWPFLEIQKRHLNTTTAMFNWLKNRQGTTEGSCRAARQRSDKSAAVGLFFVQDSTGDRRQVTLNLCLLPAASWLNTIATLQRPQ